MDRDAGTRGADHFSRGRCRIGLVIGLGLVFFAINVAGGLYQTTPMLALAESVVFVPHYGDEPA